MGTDKTVDKDVYKVLSQRWEIVVPPQIAVYNDKKTNAKTVAFPFDFPDGRHGVIMVCNIEKKAWVPSEDIKTITINFV